MQQIPDLIPPEYVQTPETPHNYNPTEIPIPQSTPLALSPPYADIPPTPLPQTPAPEPKIAYTLLRPSSRSTLRPSSAVRTFEYLVLEKETKQVPSSSLSQHAHYFLGSSFR